tara:strand:+ start:8575 stop:10203 length:1629 start_codon:yes stop_codon:yes gene_type:complete
LNTTIDIAADDLATVWQILNKHLKPSIIKWAFGSRAKWSAKTHSDLDLALQDPYGKTIPFDTIANLQADFEDSDLPWKVDIIDLNDIDEDFRIKITYTAVKLPSFGDEEFITLQYAVESANTGLDAIKRAPIVEHNTGIKCLRIQDISQSKPFFSWGYTEVTANNFQKFQLIKDDILIARTGASIGVNKYIEKSLSSVYNNGLIRLRINREKFNSKFIYYVLQSDKFKEHINSIAFSTSAQPNMKIRDLLKFEFKNLELSTQNYIENILSALDSKIELNRQINQTLESMAQAMFKSWFVDFDPVIDNALKAGNPIPEELQERADKRAQLHQSGQAKGLPEDIQALFPDRFVLSEEMGWVPEGWEEIKLNELVEIKYGKDHKSLEDGTIPVYGSGGLMRFVNKSLYTGESVLIPRKGTLSNILYVNGDFWTVDTMFYSIPKKNLYPKYVYYHLKRLDFNSMNVGSAVPSMTTKVLNELAVLLPNENVLFKYNEVINSFFKKIQATALEIKEILKLRETLLPKLISGELRIPEAEAQVQEALSS